MTSTRYSTLLGIFSLLVPYSETLLLDRVASNGNESSNISKFDVDKKLLFVRARTPRIFGDKFGDEFVTKFSDKLGDH